MAEPLQFDSNGLDPDFGEKLHCSLCDVVVYVKTGPYMTFSASHDCPGFGNTKSAHNFKDNMQRRRLS